MTDLDPAVEAIRARQQEMSADNPLPTAAAIVIIAFAVSVLLAVTTLIVSLVQPAEAEDTSRYLYVKEDVLRRAFDRCEPYDATFEQTLACTQAIYGSGL